jgi:hypothetical protein
MIRAMALQLSFSATFIWRPRSFCYFMCYRNGSGSGGDFPSQSVIGGGANRLEENSKDGPGNAAADGLRRINLNDGDWRDRLLN